MSSTNTKFKNSINGKIFLVTGGTGSFGKRFVFTLLEKYNPKKIIILSRDELKQYEIKKKFIKVKTIKN